MRDRGYSFNLDELLKLDERRRELLVELESLRARQNVANKEIGVLQRENKDFSAKIKELSKTSESASSVLTDVEDIDKKLDVLIYKVPNFPHISTPQGSDSSHNKKVRQHGNEKRFNYKCKTHLEIGEKLGILDFKRASKIAGSGFALFMGKGARLVRALVNFMLDLHTSKHGYVEVWPPALVNRKSMTGTGQLPNLEEDMYRLRDEDYFLIPTAEVPVTNLLQGEVLGEDALPIYYTAYTPCFRREAGSYGKDTKGLLRVHQFDKVELVKFVRPETSYEELEKLVGNAEEVLKALGLTFRTMELCRGDLSFASTKCYDLEVWAPGVEKWLEVSSCSNFEDFQARRIGIRYRPKTGKGLEFVHTLNGSGVALARTVAALLESGQEENGTVRLPECLAPYLGGDLILK